MRNYKVYLEEMEKVMKDKLFFLKHINIEDYDLIIDFGCANGELLSRLNVKQSKLIGIDKDKFMLKLAKKKLPNVIFYSSLNDIPKQLIENRKILLIASSVLHEINIYEWGNLKLFIKDYVHTFVARDMIEPENGHFYYKQYVKNIVKDCHPSVIYKWFNERRSLETLKEISEFLLKMDYVDDYDLEIQEYYFNVYLSVLEEHLKGYHFETIMKKDFTIPPMIKKQKKYGLPKFRTHRKVIMIKKSEA